MLRSSQVLPDTALFELVMATNYAVEGFDVAFIEEGPGKTPDLRLSEDHSWLTDGTVEVFSRLERPPPPFPAFPNATTLDNDEPSWRQRFRPSNA